MIETEINSVNISSIRHRAIAGTVAGLLVLAACGGDDEDSDTTDATEETSAATDAPEGTDAPEDSSMDTTEDSSMDTTEDSSMTTEGGTDTTTGGTAGGETPELEGGDVFVTGSSTVEPISIRVGELASELSGGDLAVTVEGPGTGDGFATFCDGGADVSDASRPINDEEIAACEENGIEYVELEVAIDGLTVATSPANTALTCLDIPALYALVGPESEGLGSWSDATALADELGSAYGAEFPDLPLDVYGPGEESGTYDTFVEFAIADLAEEREADEVTRADYSSSANDNLIVEGIESSESSLGWIGYAYYQAEAERMTAFEIDGGDGCVAPTTETIADGSYPFSRSLYIYVSKNAAEENPAVASYVDLYLSAEGLATVADAGYVDLPADRVQATIDAWTGR